MIIAVSGMISSGKSTLVKKLSSHYGNENLSLSEYEDNDFIFDTYLDWFLKNKPHVGLSFDIYVMDSHIHRVEAIREKFKNLNLDESKNFIFLDRFPLEHCIFAYIDFENEWNQNYLEIYKAGVTELVSANSLPDFVIFLDMNFETFKERILKRSRPAEINNWEASLWYWEKLHSIYKTEFLKLCAEFNVKYQIIDTDNKSEEEVFKESQELINNFLKQGGNY
ncbi:deoxynucleoside kinase [Mycoplasmopsis glycophila]|uniref:Deoxyguanosine kinase n=1 Tax=Mycoplasmopsis glycophila TaxID=171285 RepID=A0A449AUQ3_9BACT|nr:deoxynucleoside kinase [Mycoplasmopsis glycophila]VEU70249.1 Deoxyguanosine kinase [Mycoplasmopsis glycophila]